MQGNLVQQMGRRELWDYLQKEDKVLADLLAEFSKSEIGKVDLVEYRLNEQDKLES